MFVLGHSRDTVGLALYSAAPPATQLLGLRDKDTLGLAKELQRNGHKCMHVIYV